MLLSFDRLSASTIVPCPRLTLVSAYLKRTAGECACCRHGVSKVSIADTAVVFYAFFKMFYFYYFCVAVSALRHPEQCPEQVSIAYTAVVFSLV